MPEADKCIYAFLSSYFYLCTIYVRKLSNKGSKCGTFFNLPGGRLGRYFYTQVLSRHSNREFQLLTRPRLSAAVTRMQEKNATLARICNACLNNSYKSQKPHYPDSSSFERSGNEDARKQIPTLARICNACLNNCYKS